MTTREQQRQDDKRVCINIPMATRQRDDTTLLHTSENTNVQNYTPTDSWSTTITPKYFHTIRAHLQRTWIEISFQNETKMRNRTFSNELLPKKQSPVRRRTWRLVVSDTRAKSTVRTTMSNIFVMSWKKEWRTAIVVVSTITVDWPYQKALEALEMWCW